MEVCLQLLDDEVVAGTSHCWASIRAVLPGAGLLDARGEGGRRGGWYAGTSRVRAGQREKSALGGMSERSGDGLRRRACVEPAGGSAVEVLS